MEPEIVITHIANSTLTGKEQRFQKSKITVGRDAPADVEFDPDEDLLVSHNHAEIFVENGRLWIRDLGARNGTYVNQRRITGPVELRPEDRVHFGANGPLVTAQLDQQDAMPRDAGLGKTGGAGLRQTVMAHLLPSFHRGVPGPGPQRPAGAAAETMDGGLLARPPRPGPARAWGPAGRAMPSMRLVLVGWIAVGMLICALFVYPFLRSLFTRVSESPPPPPLAEEQPVRTIAALGRLTPDGGMLPVGGPTGQTVKKLEVEEGQTVASGAPLAQLSSYDTLNAEYEAALTARDEAAALLQKTKEYAAATVEEAKAKIQQTGKPLDLEIDAAKADIDLLQSHLNIAIEDRKQLEKLEKPGGPKSSQLIHQELVEQRAQRDKTAAEKRLEQLRGSLEPRRGEAQAALRTTIANQSRLEQSVSLKTAEKTLQRAKTQLEQATLRAPRDGKVLKILCREGAVLGSQPLLYLGDTRRMVVIAEVYETEVRYLIPGQRAAITSPALPEELHGRVEKVLGTVERNTLRDLNPTAPGDLRVVEVRIRLDDREVTRHQPLLAELVNLEVQVRIQRE